MRDLIVLTADKDAEFALKGLLARPQALGIRLIAWDSYVHPRRDPGLVNEAHDFLRPFHQRHTHALVMFDQSGCGRDSEAPADLARDVEDRLAANGWRERAAVVILVPELEVWVWSNSPHVAACLGWGGASAPLRAWLEGKGLWQSGTPKPADPKAALDAALRHVGKPRSSSLYQELASKVSLQGHTEPAFIALRTNLQRWFPVC